MILRRQGRTLEQQQTYFLFFYNKRIQSDVCVYVLRHPGHSCLRLDLVCNWTKLADDISMDGTVSMLTTRMLT